MLFRSSKTQIPESEYTEHGPRNEIQSPESENNTDIQIDFYHTEDKPYYRAYYETKVYTDREEILEPIPVNDEEDPVIEVHIMASETIHNTATKIHIQRLFGMNDNSYTSFKIKNILSVNIHGEETLLAFNWTDIKDRNDNNLVNEDLYYGNPIMMIKVYMAARLWPNSEVLFPYLVAIGRHDPMYRKHSFMLMKPNETGDNEKSFGQQYCTIVQQ